jgi:hypothetical protein
VEYPGHAGPPFCGFEAAYGEQDASSRNQQTTNAYGTRNVDPTDSLCFALPRIFRPWAPRFQWAAPRGGLRAMLARSAVWSQSTFPSGCTRVPDSGCPRIGPRRERWAPAFFFRGIRARGPDSIRFAPGEVLRFRGPGEIIPPSHLLDVIRADGSALAFGPLSVGSGKHRLFAEGPRSCSRRF